MPSALRYVIDVSPDGSPSSSGGTLSSVEMRASSKVRSSSSAMSFGLMLTGVSVTPPLRMAGAPCAESRALT